MASDQEGNLFYIGEVEEDLETIFLPLTKEIEKQATLRKGRLDFYINSIGGYSHLAFHLIELMELAKARDIVVRTIVTDLAASAGSAISVAGTPGERYIAKDARALIHYGTTWSINSSLKQAERNSAADTAHFKRIVKHYEKYCEIPDLEEHISDDMWWISARDAIKWKIADKYINKLEL